MPANARQKSLYRNRWNIWRRVARTVAGDGEPIETGWYLVAANVICLVGPSESFSDDVMGAGLQAESSRRTVSKVHFVIDQDVLEGDIGVEVTVDRSGAKISGFYGRAYKTVGRPQMVPALGNRGANFRGFDCELLPHLPEGVTVP